MKLSELRKLGEAATGVPIQAVLDESADIWPPLYLLRTGAEGGIVADLLSEKNAKFYAAARNHWSALMDVVAAAKLARSTSDPVLAHYVSLDVALAALEAIGEEEKDE